MTKHQAISEDPNIYRADDQQSSVQRIEQLLRRYPAIDAPQATELISLIKKAPLREMALMSGRDVVGPNLAAFQREHARQFRPGLLANLLFALIAPSIIVFFVWITS
ncbi:MAG: hypothetical protein ACK4SZ_15655 [Allosphingosinicella sp.]|uniref:hypothetical protein n=1 Tax=Allosphingosinicella sp. TaxID=2823234 RepID=UPI00392BC967